mmetsp:Transcript_43199/g.106682  ORF Transcript_43199/g.106682 Transcript_43199/m.106682 type:complete len:224 (+) Transcript_43199:981-1652(+)
MEHCEAVRPIAMAERPTADSPYCEPASPYNPPPANEEARATAAVAPELWAPGPRGSSPYSALGARAWGGARVPPACALRARQTLTDVRAPPLERTLAASEAAAERREPMVSRLAIMLPSRFHETSPPPPPPRDIMERRFCGAGDTSQIIEKSRISGRVSALTRTRQSAASPGWTYPSVGSTEQSCSKSECACRQWKETGDSDTLRTNTARVTTACSGTRPTST